MSHYLASQQNNGGKPILLQKGISETKPHWNNWLYFQIWKASNAVLIHQNLPQSERIKQLNSIAITQMKSLLGSKSIKKLK